jgi:photosystem II stability/assembly factor-like uncharacterized protein
MNAMLSNIQKYLVVFLIFTLTACAPTELQHSLAPTASSSQSSTAYPLSTAYPGPAQPSMTVPSVGTLQPVTPVPSLTPPVLASTAEVLSPSPQITQLQMFDINTGWAIYATPSIHTEKSKILRTTQGIQNWIDVTPKILDNSSDIYAPFFIDANTAVVISSNSSLTTSSAEVIPWRTTDDGKTWQTGEPLRIEQVNEFYPKELFFIDPEHGWMLGESDSGMQNMRVHFFETQDGGLLWKTVYDTVDHLSDTDTLWIKGYYPFPEHFTFNTETTGFFSDGRLFRTQDGARSWVFHPLDPPADLSDIDCQGGYCKYLDVVSAPRFTSTQDGVLIRRAYLNSDVVMDVFIYYPNTLNRLPFPTAQYLYFTHDGGQTWVPKPSPVKIGTAYFLNTQTGWILGKNNPDSATVTQLFQTKDGGETWSQIALDCLLPLGSELQFVDEQNGFAYYPSDVIDYYKDFDQRVGQTTSLYSTNDGGHSWEIVEPQIVP